MDFQRLLEVLEPTLMHVCRSSLEKHSGEEFYSIALYTSEEYSYLVDSFSTYEGLQHVARDYLSNQRYRQEWKTEEVAMKELKWSPCDSPYHGEFSSEFRLVGELLDSIWSSRSEDSDEEYMKTCQDINDTFLEALIRVRKSDVFDSDMIVFNLLMGDQSDEDRYLNAEAVNPETQLSLLRRELDLDEDSLNDLRKNRWTV